MREWPLKNIKKSAPVIIFAGGREVGRFMKTKFFILIVTILINAGAYAGGINKYIEDQWMILEIFWDNSEEDVC